MSLWTSQTLPNVEFENGMHNPGHIPYLPHEHVPLPTLSTHLFLRHKLRVRWCYGQHCCFMDTHHREWQEFLALCWLVPPLCLDLVSALPSQALRCSNFVPHCLLFAVSHFDLSPLQANLGSVNIGFRWARNCLQALWTAERGYEENTRDFFWRSSFLVDNPWMTF